MWVLISVLLASAQANVFVFSARPYQSRLAITNEALTFSSVRLNKDITLNPCTRPLARALNTKVFKSVIGNRELGGPAVTVDGVEFFLKRELDSTTFFTNLDYQVMAIDMKARSTCKLQK